MSVSPSCGVPKNVEITPFLAPGYHPLQPYQLVLKTGARKRMWVRIPPPPFI